MILNFQLKEKLKCMSFSMIILKKNDSILIQVAL